MINYRMTKWLGACALLAMLGGCAATTEKSVERPDFNGFWMVSEYDEIVRPNMVAAYTDLALERLKLYQDNFDPVAESSMIFCAPPGMPMTTLARARDYPRQIYQSEDRMFFLSEFMDGYRQIHIGKTEVPANFAGSREGYSTAHWEGDELVVRTEGFLDLRFSVMQRSEEAVITERWRKIDHPKYGESIEIELKWEDPLMLKEPIFGRALWQRADEGTVINAYACPETLWENYVYDKLDAQ